MAHNDDTGQVPHTGGYIGAGGGDYKPGCEACQLERLKKAANAIYDAAHWSPDRQVDAAKLWTELRDALGRPPGTSPKLEHAHAILQDTERCSCGLSPNEIEMRREPYRHANIYIIPGEWIK